MQVREVTEYRRTVYGLVRGVLERHAAFDAGAPAVAWGDPAWALFMAFEHERIHVETSSVLIRELPLQFLREPQWVRPAVPLAGATATGGVRHRRARGVLSQQIVTE